MAHKGPISGVAVGPGGYVATAGYDNQVIVWDSAKGVPVARGCHDHLVNNCTFSADGKRLYSAGSDYTARVWRTRDMRLLQVLSGHKDDVEMVAPHGSGQMVATCSRDGTLRVYDQNGAVLACLQGHQADVISLSWVGVGDRLVSSGDDSTIRVWSARQGKLLEVHRFDGVETDTVVAVSEQLMFAGNDDGQIVVVSNGRVSLVPAHRAGIKRVAADQRTKSLIVTSYDGEFTVWSYDDHGAVSLRHRERYPEGVWPRSCAFLSRNRVVFGSFRAGYAVYDVALQKWSYADESAYKNTNALLKCSDGVYTIGDAGILWRDGVQIAEVPSLCNTMADWKGVLVGAGQSGELFDLRRGDVLYRHHAPLNIAIAAEVLGSDCLFLGSYTGEVVRLSMRHGDVTVAAQGKVHSNAIKGLAVAAGQVFTVCANSDAAWSDAVDLTTVEVMSKAHDKIANGCVALASGRFASISRDMKLRLWQGNEPRIIDTPHDHSIKAVAGSRDGRIVATASYSGHLALYDVEADRWIYDHRVSFNGIPALEQGFRERMLCADYHGRLYDIDWSADEKRGAFDR